MSGCSTLRINTLSLFGTPIIRDRYVYKSQTKICYRLNLNDSPCESHNLPERLKKLPPPMSPGPLKPKIKGLLTTVPTLRNENRVTISNLESMRFVN